MMGWSVVEDGQRSAACVHETTASKMYPLISQKTRPQTTVVTLEPVPPLQHMSHNTVECMQHVHGVGHWIEQLHGQLQLCGRFKSGPLQEADGERHTNKLDTTFASRHNHAKARPNDTHNARRDRHMHAVDLNKCSCAHHSDKGRNLLGRSKRDKPERHLCACTGRSRGCVPSDGALCPRPGPLAKWRSHAAFLIPPEATKKSLG